MASNPKHFYTPEEYLEIDRNSEYKYEYFDGEIVAMVGASETHNLIVGNVITSLNNKLKNRPCKVYPSDMKVKIPRVRTYSYPDISVVCGESKFDDKQKDVLLNPILIFEVLSDSTETKDRGTKFIKYRRIESLQEYVMISQHENRVEVYFRKDDKWVLTEFLGKSATAYFSSISCKVSLKSIYSKIHFIS